MLNDVIPLVERAYRVQKDRSQRAITGLSMGGGQSLTIGLQHTDLYLADFMPRLFRNGKAAGS